MGGTDDPSNLVLLTVEEHALAHKKLWEQYGRWQDELAYKGLIKLITHDEAVLISRLKSNSGKSLSETHRKNISESLKGHKLSEETKRKISQTVKAKDLPPINKGKKFSETTKQKMSINAKNRKKITCSCGKTVDSSNYARWHKSC